MFLPKGSQLQPKFAPTKDPLSVAVAAILHNSTTMQTNDDVQVPVTFVDRDQAVADN
jgi:hypothetical protein